MHELVHSVYADLGPVGGLVANAGVVRTGEGRPKGLLQLILLSLPPGRL